MREKNADQLQSNPDETEVDFDGETCPKSGIILQKHEKKVTLSLGACPQRKYAMSTMTFTGKK